VYELTNCKTVYHTTIQLVHLPQLSNNATVYSVANEKKDVDFDSI